MPPRVSLAVLIGFLVAQPSPANLCQRNIRRCLCRERTYRSFISFRVKCRPACTCCSRFIRASNSCVPPLRAVNCSSHLPNIALSVVCSDLANRRACSIRCSTALRVIFFITKMGVHDLRVPGKCPYGRGANGRTSPPKWSGGIADRRPNGRRALPLGPYNLGQPG
jgi:hypothetical protein